MNDQSKIEKFYKNILPEDVLCKVADDYKKIVEAQEIKLQANKKEIESNLRKIDNQKFRGPWLFLA